jgi:hypothetical protein
MATTSTYYLNGPSLLSSTAVFTDAALTTCAADGYYRQGTVVRQMVGCVLLPPQTCPSCVDECGGGTIESANGYAVSTVSLETGQTPSSIGAIVIRFNPLTVPDGIQVEFNGVIYNELSSPTYGYLAGLSNQATYIGPTAGDCGLVSGSPHVLDVYNWYSGAFQSPTTTETVTIASGQLDLTATSPGECVMVVPKTVAIPSIIDVKIISPCPSNDFVLSVECPIALSSFACSTGFAESITACASDEGETYYYVHVNGASGVLGLYDWVFSDQNGANVLPNNYYKSAACPAANEWFRVESGVIVEFGTCL